MADANPLHRQHRLLIELEPDDGLFHASILEPGEGTVHWAMSGPPRPYGETVTELLDALRRHLLTPGE